MKSSQKISHQNRVDETSLEAQYLGLLANSLRAARELWGSLSVKDCSNLLVFKRIEKAALTLDSYMQHYLEIDQPQAAYESIKSFSQIIKQYQSSLSETVQSEIHRFLNRMTQMEFWFVQFNQSAASKEISWADPAVVSKSGLFSSSSSQTLHVTLDNNINKNTK